MAKSTRNITRGEHQQPSVALDSPTAVEELPFRFAHYPNHYGTFITFSEHEHSEQFFCSCQEGTVKNCLELHGHKFNPKAGIKGSSWGLHLDFPNSIVEQLESKVELSKIFKFESSICHRCNMVTPSLRWCHEMYGSNFKQYHGWYINQASIRLGFKDYQYLRDKCSIEIVELIELAKREYDEGFDNPKDAKNASAKIRKLPENIAREDFGFRKIGEGWVSETLLFNLVSQIYPNKLIYRHFRPDWLQNLEFDIFIPEQNLAFEYQGQQHYHPIKAWGGKKALAELQERDNLKRQLALANGVRLIEVAYTEPLTIEWIRKKLKTNTDNNR